MFLKLQGMFIPFTVLLLLIGCSTEENSIQQPDTNTRVKEEKPPQHRLVEDRKIYTEDKMDSVVELYVTVVKESPSTKKMTTFYELNHSNSTTIQNGDDPKVKVIIQEGSPEGPALGHFGFSAQQPNGTMEIRGASSRGSDQKSYKLRLLDNAGYWKDQTVINLNKHKNDITRIRQKLSFDYFKIIPDFASLRTQFVHLHIKDLTSEPPSTEYEDFGLYTHVENPNKAFLAAHGLDRNGNLYKAENFDFSRYPNQIKLKSDSNYDKKAFESILEIKGSEDHQKLIKMLEDLNNYTVNINDVIDEHFDRDNYFTWLAVNILMGNLDTNAHNFLLYSPSDSSKWYFLPWDYDLSWGFFQEEEKRTPNIKLAKWQTGISNYWWSFLHSRVFKDANNVKQLNKKIEELSKIITKEQTEKYLKNYYPIASKYVKSRPDLYQLKEDVKYFDIEMGLIPTEPERNKSRYYQSLEVPMPFFLGEVEKQGDNHVLTWGHAYDLQADDITYDIMISSDPSFSTILYQGKNLMIPKFSIAGLKKGVYYWRVVAKDSKGQTQVAFDRVDIDEVRYNGVKEFVVK